MTQMLEPVETAPTQEWSQRAELRSHLPSGQEFEQFDYRPMPILAPLAGALGVCSLLAYVGLFGVGLALIGILIGLLAVIVVKRSAGALSGMGIAAGGLLLSVTSAAGGIGLQVYQYQNEVPEGFARVNFYQDISKRGFVIENGGQRVPPEVEALFGKPIFLKGFMYPTGQTEGLAGFLLLKDSGQCCFGGQPALQDMIGVRMAPGKEVDYYAGRVAIAGTLKVNERYLGGDLEPVYLLDAEHFSKAKTSF